MTDSIEKAGKTVEEAIESALRELGCSRDEAETEILSMPTKGFLGLLGAKEARVRVWKKDGAGTAALSAAGTAGIAGAGAEKAKKGTAGENEAKGEKKAREDRGIEERTYTTDKTKVTEKTEEKEKAEDKTATEVFAPEVFPPEDGDTIAKFITDVTGLMGIEAGIGKREDAEAVYYTLSGPKMGVIIGRRGDTLDALQYLSNIVAGKDRDEFRKRIIVDAEDYRRRREDTLVRLAMRLANKAKRGGHRVVLEPMSPLERRVIHTALQNDPEIRTQSEGEEPYRRLVIYPAGGENRYDRGGGDRDGRVGGRYGRDGRKGNYGGGSGYGKSNSARRGQGYSHGGNEAGEAAGEEKEMS